MVGSSLTPRLQPDTLSDPDIHAVYTPLKYVAHPLAGSFSLNLPRSCCNSDAWYHAHLPHARAAANFSLSSAVTLVFHSAEPSPGVFTNFTFGPVKLFSVETLRPSKFGRLYRAALVACAYFLMMALLAQLQLLETFATASTTAFTTLSPANVVFTND